MDSFCSSRSSTAPDPSDVGAPTLVIHGAADPLVSPSGGRATARAIKGSRLMLIDGMGHDLPRAVWPQLIDGIIENGARAGDVSQRHPPSPVDSTPLSGLSG